MVNQKHIDLIRRGSTAVNDHRRKHPSVIINASHGFFYGIQLQETRLGGSKFKGARFSSVNLAWADLYKADLEWSNFCASDLCYTNLSRANLYKATFITTQLTGACLRHSNLSRASFAASSLQNADLREADLSWANLSDVNLNGADLRNAKLTGAHLPSPAMILSAWWGKLPPEIAVPLARLDAFAHPRPEAFVEWAKGGPCPYEETIVRPICNFEYEIVRKHFTPGLPPTLWEAMRLVLDYWCPGWYVKGWRVI